MHENPNFNQFSPSDQKYFDYLDRLWLHLPFETPRIDYLKAIIGRSKIVSAYVNDQNNPYRAMKLYEQNDVAYSCFLDYMDALFAVPADRTDRAHYITETLHTADLSQEKLNQIDLSRPQLYEESTLRSKVQEMLLADSDDSAKQNIVAVFEHDIYDTVRRHTGQI